MSSGAMTGIRRASDTLLIILAISAWQIGSHLWLLDLPFFWDEAGYYIPAANDFFNSGVLTPITVPSSGHPPLLSIYLSISWLLFGNSIIVTRLSIAVLSALGLFSVFLLGRDAGDKRSGMLSVLMVACFPLYFAQSTMALADLPSASFSLLSIVLFIREKRGAIVAAVAACLFKETAVLVPAALLLYGSFGSTVVNGLKLPIARRGQHLALQMLLASVACLVIWYSYHLSVTGFLFGSPEFFSYNFADNLNVLRVTLGGLYRFWHGFGHLGLFSITVPSLFICMRQKSLSEGTLRILWITGCLLMVHVIALSVLGGALLARYMLPVIPIVIVACVCLLRKHQWIIGIALIVFFLFFPGNLPYNYAIEETLKYVEFVDVHKDACAYISGNLSEAEIVTSWPATFELSRPELGFVSAPVKIVEQAILNQAQLAHAVQGSSGRGIVMFFNRNYDPGESILRPRRLLSLIPGWRETSEMVGTREAFDRTAAAVGDGVQVLKHWERGSFYVMLVTAPVYPTPSSPSGPRHHYTQEIEAPDPSRTK